MPEPEVPTKDAATGGEVTLDQLKAELAAKEKALADEAAKRAAAEKNYQAQSAVLAAAKREAEEAKRARAAARRQPPPDDDDDSDEPESPVNGRTPRASELELRLAQQEQVTGMLNYKIDHPDALPYWEEIMSMILDPMKVEDVVHRNADGSVNTYKTFAKAHEKVEVAKLRAAQSDARSQEEKKKADELKSRAVITGGGAFDRGDTSDLAGKSAEEQRKILVQRGAIQYDPEDPPSWARRR